MDIQRNKYPFIFTVRLLQVGWFARQLKMGGHGKGDAYIYNDAWINIAEKDMI